MDASRPDNAIELADEVWIRPDNLRYRFSRSSGPGGQSVNKLSTKAELRITLADLQGLDEKGVDRLRKLAGQRLTNNDELVLHADASRSQLENRQACLDRLCELVGRAAIKPKVRRKKKPTRAMIERRLEEKRRISTRKSGRKRPLSEDSD